MPDSFDRTAYTSIPPQLWSVYDRLCKEYPQHKLVQAVQRQGVEKTWRGIDEIFCLASQATGLKPDKLFASLGFGINDFDSANFQAMMGILRAINMLHQYGLTEFKPLRPRQDRKEADFLAKRGDSLYAVEVFRSSEDAYRYANSDDPTSAFVTYLAGRIREKLPQVQATMTAHNCVAGMVVVVMDSFPSKALNNVDEYREAVRIAFEQVGRPDAIHVFLFTGMANVNGTNEHVCHPPLARLGQEVC